MIILIAGASHTGKTVLAQRMLERFGFPYLSIDHLKMGLIRSGNTDLTPMDDDKLTDYLWPIVREMIKTAIENNQNLIVEGCYIPGNWRKDMGIKYLKDIRYICLAFSDNYIDRYFTNIMAHESDVEKRSFDSDLTPEWFKEQNHIVIEECNRNSLGVTVIDSDYDMIIDGLINEIAAELY
ncbi:MAG: adenylate kinase [Clostridiales bacterium]|nr:adenylate kinase [Clostridiales bacterium]